mmetsp:Transcript_18781/g.45316  ORF Transcript_18781/g.45316 Transcript_18781/m.45316 type:complete len:233 (+) Transcript_18781:1020-1718(+)
MCRAGQEAQRSTQGRILQPHPGIRGGGCGQEDRGVRVLHAVAHGGVPGGCGGAGGREGYREVHPAAPAALFRYVRAADRDPAYRLAAAGRTVRRSARGFRRGCPSEDQQHEAVFGGSWGPGMRIPQGVCFDGSRSRARGADHRHGHGHDRDLQPQPAVPVPAEGRTEAQVPHGSGGRAADQPEPEGGGSHGQSRAGYGGHFPRYLLDIQELDCERIGQHPGSLVCRPEVRVV